MLVVDDHVDTAATVAKLLHSWGYETHAATSGMQALELARSHCPHLIILDLMMPVMDGFELARQLRILPNSHPSLLVAYTAPDDLERRRKAIEAGIGYYLVKPADPDDFRHLIDIAESQRDDE